MDSPMFTHDDHMMLDPPSQATFSTDQSYTNSSQGPHGRGGRQNGNQFGPNSSAEVSDDTDLSMVSRSATTASQSNTPSQSQSMTPSQGGRRLLGAHAAYGTRGAAQSGGAAYNNFVNNNGHSPIASSGHNNNGNNVNGSVHDNDSSITGHSAYHMSFRSVVDDEKMRQAATQATTTTSNSDQKSTDKRIVGDYILGETIGMGGYSKVKLGYHVRTQARVALKIMFGGLSGKIDEKTKRHLLREIEVMKTVKNKNVLKLVDFYKEAQYPERNGSTRPCVITVLEYAPCGELFDYLMFTGAFGDVATRTYTHQMMDGLHAMHKKGFAHRDLKPENLLLDKNFVLKIADFGFARSFVDANDIIQHMLTTCGTKGYLAPEVLSRKPYTYKADLFTMGIIIFTTYCAFPPFQEAADTDWWWKNLSKGITYLEKSKKYAKSDPNKGKQYTMHGIKCLTQFWDNHTKRLKIDQEFQELMINMLHPLPERRFNHQQIRNHRWYNQRIMTTDELTAFMQERINAVSKNRKKKVLQMVKDRDVGGGGSGHAKPAGGVRGVASLAQTRMERHMGNSQFFEIMDRIDPYRRFLENIEYEKDMPKAGIRHEFTTKCDPTEIAARLFVACDQLKYEPTSSNRKNSLVDTGAPFKYHVEVATVESFPNSNQSIMHCIVIRENDPSRFKHEVALKIKQYVQGTRFYYPRKTKRYIKYRDLKTHAKQNGTYVSDDESDDDDSKYNDDNNDHDHDAVSVASDIDHYQDLSDSGEDDGDDVNNNTSNNDNDKGLIYEPTKLKKSDTNDELTESTTGTSGSPPPTGKQPSASADSTNTNNNTAQKTNEKENVYTVQITKWRGSKIAFETAVADLLATDRLFTAIVLGADYAQQ